MKQLRGNCPNCGTPLMSQATLFRYTTRLLSVMCPYCREMHSAWEWMSREWQKQYREIHGRQPEGTAS